MDYDLYPSCRDLLGNPWVSDLHITVGDPVRVRESGSLVFTDAAIVDDQGIRQLLKQLRHDLSDPESVIQRAETRRDGGEARTGYDFSASIGTHRCRCNLSRANGGSLSLVLRRLSENVPDLDSLGLPFSVIQQIDRPTGLILVTGPTGSGKSTTLASMLDYLNRTASKRILTIEDPVEYVIRPAKCKVTRKEVGTDAASFLSALRAAVRQDPDIIMVGEIRDLETMRAALSAAETGHLVFATLHTNSAPKTIDRVGSFFPESEKNWAYAVLASVINCIVSQTLVPRMDGEGRALAREILIGTSAIKANIKEAKLNLITNDIEQGGSSGHQSLSRHLSDLVSQKIISRDAAMGQAYDPSRLGEYLSRVGLN